MNKRNRMKNVVVEKKKPPRVSVSVQGLFLGFMARDKGERMVERLSLKYRLKAKTKPE